MSSAPSPKQQISQSIKDATNILVTVSNDPSVDELSAALGLALFLNSLGKHATAVFSGKVPPAITFLEPDKTFEDTADSLRDFIIALDKAKADHLRYKVVDDAVKIFITPYKTTISEGDLEFTQGDYNVELVLALNVENSDHLDKALTAHGKILHGASIHTITAGAIKSSLGTTDWHQADASGVSEMLVELIDGLKTAKVALDEQMATALMTGIVAATERFANDLTTSKTMNAAAELMAAGANQQLIAAKLTEGEMDETNGSPAIKSVENTDGSTILSEGESTKLATDHQEEQPEPVAEEEHDGSLKIAHEKVGTLDEVARQTQAEAQDQAAKVAEAHLEEHLANTPDSIAADMPELPQVEALDAPVLATSIDAAQSQDAQLTPAVAANQMDEPTIGGTLNATTEEAAAQKRREKASDQNKTILSHGNYIGDQSPSFGDTPLNAAMAVSGEPASVDPFAALPAVEKQEVASHPISGERVIMPLGVSPTPNSMPPTDGALMTALAQDTDALTAGSYEPAAMPEQLASTQPTPPQEEHAAFADVEAALAAAPEPLSSTQTLAELDASTRNILPPMPDFSTLPPLPPAPTGVAPTEMPLLPTLEQSPAPAADFNPSQFQIPQQ